MARLLNFGGSANLLAAVSLTLASILAVRRHTGRPLIPVLLTLAVSYVVVVPLKVVADRAAPHSIRRTRSSCSRTTPAGRTRRATS